MAPWCVVRVLSVVSSVWWQCGSRCCPSVVWLCVVKGLVGLRRVSSSVQLRVSFTLLVSLGRFGAGGTVLG